VQNFWQDYKELFPLAYQELDSITLRINKHTGPIYFYLPCDEVRTINQNEFIAKQIKNINIKSNSLFIVKNHPNDVGHKNWKILDSYGECINIGNYHNSYTPAEFIIIFLNIKNVIGSASSTLFYLQSWVPEISTFIYNDYEQFMLTDSSASMKDNLRLVGLLSDPTQ
jgi:hypothetical protein